MSPPHPPACSGPNQDTEYVIEQKHVILLAVYLLGKKSFT